MKFCKRIIALLLMMTMVLLNFAGCSDSKEKAKESVD